LSEFARRALGAQIAKPYQSDAGAVRAITLDPRLEQQIAQGVRQSPTEVALLLEPKTARHIMDWLSRYVQQMLSSGHQPVVVCGPHIRLGFKRFFESTFADLTVLSYAEIPSRLEIQNAGVIPAPEG
jgi:flagellar biosynthesis protein FlhA